MQPFAAYLLVLALASLTLLAGWFHQRRTRNAGIVDVLWAGGVGAAALVLALALDGWAPRRGLVAGLGVLWSVRLTRHLYRRYRGGDEDRRYAALRERLGDRFDAWMFGFFQLQALWIALFASAYFPALTSNAERWFWTDAAALVWALLALWGEATADRQLAAWVRDPRTRGQTCRAGLWRYSRHPNYFFEWAFWLAFGLQAIPLEHGWVALFTPVMLYFLLTRVTGIPPAERSSLASRGDDYRAYQRTTNAFFPGPPKQGGKTDER